MYNMYLCCICIYILFFSGVTPEVIFKLIGIVRKNTSHTTLAKKSISNKPLFNTLRPRQNGCHFADDNFKRISLNENARILIEISLKFVPTGPINNISALVLIMAWRRTGGKPLYEPMMASLLIHICLARPQWVKAMMTNLLIVLLASYLRSEIVGSSPTWNKTFSAIKTSIAP